jgi:hypothetical protein
MTVDLFGYSLTGKAAWIAIAVLAVLVALVVQNPSILGWLLSAFYSGPR